jgi:hypothetical protein
MVAVGTARARDAVLAIRSALNFILIDGSRRNECDCKSVILGLELNNGVDLNGL